MKKLNNFWLSLAIQIVFVFGIAIAYTFIIDVLNNSGFLDSPCEIYKYEKCIGCTNYPKGVYHTHWGARHHLLFWMNFFLMCVSIMRLIIWIEKNSKKI